MLTDAEVAELKQRESELQQQIIDLQNEQDEIIVTLNKDRLDKLKQRYIDEYGIDPEKYYVLPDGRWFKIVEYSENGNIRLRIQHTIRAIPMHINVFLANYQGWVEGRDNG